MTIQLSSGPEISTTLGDVVPAVMAPLAAALLGGIAGLLLVQSMSPADHRLLVAGYSARQLVVARLALLSTIGLVASVAAVASGLGVLAGLVVVAVWVIRRSATSAS